MPAPQALSNGEEFVATPYGYRPKSFCRHVPDGYKLKFNDHGEVVAVHEHTGHVVIYPEPSAEALAWLDAHRSSK